MSTVHQRHRHTDGQTDRRTTYDSNSALCTTRFRWNRAKLSLFGPRPHLPSFIQVHPSVRDSLAKTTFQIVTIYGDEIGSPIGKNGISLLDHSVCWNTWLQTCGKFIPDKSRSERTIEILIGRKLLRFWSVRFRQRREKKSQRCGHYRRIATTLRRSAGKRNVRGCFWAWFSKWEPCFGHMACGWVGLRSVVRWPTPVTLACPWWGSPTASELPSEECPA